MIDPEHKRAIQDHVAQRTKNPAGSRARMLRVACRNPGRCLALGEYGEVVKDFFGGFRDLSLVDSFKVRRLGGNSESINGFVLELPFHREGYDALAVLKFTTKATADNLYYEYRVGKHVINPLLRQFPCFVETYDYYLFRSTTAWETAKKFAQDGPGRRAFGAARPSLPPLDALLDVQRTGTDADSAWARSCADASKSAVLIQHFDHFDTWMDILEKTFLKGAAAKFQMFQVMLQVYLPLACIAHTFTHTDLHAHNVGMYRPFGDERKYIQMHYHYGDQIVSFRSAYIAKVIDYGRSAVAAPGLNTRAVMENYVCPASECGGEKSCGATDGYASFVKYSAASRGMVTADVSTPNYSTDLRLVMIMRTLLPGHPFMQKVLKTLPEYPIESPNVALFAKREPLRTPIEYSNVYDVVAALLDLVPSVSKDTEQKIYPDAEWVCGADMHVYSDPVDSARARAYTFEPRLLRE